MEYSNIIKGKKGAVLLFAALLLPLLFAFAGLAFDLGNMYALHSRLQNSADAAALLMLITGVKGRQDYFAYGPYLALGGVIVHGLGAAL